MRYLTARCPDIRRVLLVESGSRPVLEAAISKMRGSFGADVALDVITCYPGIPGALGPGSRVWRTQDHASGAGRVRILNELQATGATVLAIVCSGEPIMTRWKWWLAWKLPMKVLLINENGDSFWLDRVHVRMLWRMVLTRLGLSGALAGRTMARVAMLPFVILYLLLYATVVHARRALRVERKAS